MKRHAALNSDDWLRDVYAMWLPSEVRWRPLLPTTRTSKLTPESKAPASSADLTPGGCGLFAPDTGNTVRIKLQSREVLFRVWFRRRTVSANREGVRAWPTA